MKTAARSLPQTLTDNLPSLTVSKSALGDQAPIDAKPDTWLPTPKHHSNGNGILGRLADLMENAVERWVRTRSYREYRTTTPLLSQTQRDEIAAKIQPGDILLESDDRLLKWRVFEAVLGVSRSPRWNHVALYAGDGIVIEAGGKIPENVHRVKLSEFLETHHVMIGRCEDCDPGKIVDYAVKRLGLPYNGRFIVSDYTYCCSELAAAALNASTRTPGEVIVKARARHFNTGYCISPQDVFRSPRIRWWFQSGPSHFWPAVWSVIKAWARIRTNPLSFP